MARRTTLYGQSAETKRRQRQAQRLAGQRRAETLRCDDCGRGNALSRPYREVDGTGVTVIRYCRYCQAPRVTRVEWPS